MRLLLSLPLLVVLAACYIEPVQQRPTTLVTAQPVYAQPTPQPLPSSELQTFMAFAAREGRSNAQRSDIRMQTSSWEPVPTIIQTSTSGPYTRAQQSRVVVAGDSSGTQASRIDNFILVEVLDANNTLLSSGLVGNTEPAFLNGRAIRQYGPQSFTPAPTDITELFPLGNVPFYVRVSALDYGGGTYTSDVWVCVGGNTVVAQPAMPVLQSMQLVHARQGRTNAQRTDIQMQTTSWERTPTIIDTTETSITTLNAPRRIFLAGNAQGTAEWTIDNYLLLEVLDPNGSVIASGLVGQTEPAILRGAAVQQLGLQSFGFAAGTPDISALFPVRRPFRLRATALDYGGAALASDVWLIVQ